MTLVPKVNALGWLPLWDAIHGGQGLRFQFDFLVGFVRGLLGFFR